jgi:hypothetical protein
MKNNKKYRILYNEKEVVSVLEDYGTTYIGAGTNLMVMVDTKENAKTMLEAIGVNIYKLFNEDVPNSPELIGIDYLDSINKSFDPYNMTGGVI